MRGTLAVTTVLGVLALARAAGAAQIGDPRLNGFWVIDDAARAVTEKSAHADLTPQGQDIAKQNAAHAADRVAHHEPVALAAATCDYIGPPFFVDTSEPWLLVVTKDSVIQAFERYQLTTRRFYTDGRTWPDLSKMPPSSAGYSIARWEGADLVVETRGMIPGRGAHGGGLKGPKTVLVERAHVEPDGDHMTWTFTWSDPDLLAHPYSYTIKYDRNPPPTYAFSETCDAHEDPSRIIDTQEKLRQ